MSSRYSLTLGVFNGLTLGVGFWTYSDNSPEMLCCHRKYRNKSPRPSQFDVPSAKEMDAYLSRIEEPHKPFVDGSCCKRVVWTDAGQVRTDLCVVYIHGWSASPRELVPFPSRLASDLKANLYYHRHPKHGLTPLKRAFSELSSITLEQLYHR